MPTNLDELATRLITRGSRFARVAGQASRTRRTLVSLRVLANLEHEGPQRLGRLADHERLTQPAMTATVNRLEADGLVVRRGDPADARAAVVCLTDAGRAELAGFRTASAEHVRPLLQGLSAGDLAVLDRAADLLEQLADQCPPATSPTANRPTAAGVR